MPTVVMEPMLATGEAARLLGVHRATFRKYVADGRLPYSRLPGGDFRFKREDVESLLAPPEKT